MREAAEGDQLSHQQPVGRFVALGKNGQLPGNVPRGQVMDGLAVEIDGPALGLHQPGQPLEQGRFARAVGADQGGDLPRRNGQAQFPNDLVAVVGQRKVFGRGHRSSCQQVMPS